MSRKLIITVNSPVTITVWKYDIFWSEPKENQTKCIIEGTIVEAMGTTIKVKFQKRFLFMKFWRTRWFSLNDKNYEISIKNAKTIKIN